MEKPEPKLETRDYVYLVFIASLCIDLALIASTVFLGLDKVALFPRTIPIISFLFFSLAIVGYFLRWVTKKKIKPEEFFALFIMLMIISTVFWSIVPTSFRIVEAQFHPVSQDPQSNPREEVYTITNYGGFLYEDDFFTDNKSIREAGNIYNSFLKLDGFVFWRTGLLFGHSPTKLDTYSGSSSGIILFFTVGPTALLESIIRSIILHFPLGLLAFILYQFGPNFYYRIRYNS